MPRRRPKFLDRRFFHLHPVLPDGDGKIGKSVWSNAFLFLPAVLLGLLAAQPLLYGSLSWFVDGELHVVRLGQLHELLRHGRLYSRWAPDMAYGFGYPLFNFYAPLVYWLALPFVALGAAHTAALAYCMAALFVMAAVFAFAWALPYVKSPLAALACTAAYVLSPYLVTNALERVAVAEHLALALLPGLLWAARRLMRAPSRTSIALYCALLAALQLGHNISALLAVPCVAITAFAELASSTSAARQRSRTLLGLIVLSLLTTGATAFFWAPALLERDAIFIERVLLEGADYRRNFMTFAAAFAVYFPQDVRRVTQFFPPQSVGPLLFVGAGIGLLAGLAQPALRRATLVLAGLAALCLFFAAAISAPLWERIPLLAFAQFPWRWLGFASLFLAGLLGVAVATVQHIMLRVPRGQALLVLLGVGLLLPTFAQLHMRNGIPAEKNYFAPQIFAHERFSGLIGSTAGNEFLPKVVTRMPDVQASRFMHGQETLQTGAFTAAILRGHPLGFKAIITAESPVELRFRQFAFPGWRATADGVALVTRPDSVDGTLLINMPAGTHVLEVDMGATLIQSIATLASILCLLCIAAWVVVAKRTTLATGVACPATAHVQIPAQQWLGLSVLLVTLLLLKVGVIDRTQSVLHPTRFDGTRVLGITVPERVNFADKILFLGLDGPQLAPARDTLTYLAFWQILQPDDIEVTTAIHVYDADDVLVAQSDNVDPAGYETKRWDKAMYAQDVHTLTLPAGLPPGDYAVQVLTYPRGKPEAPFKIIGGQTRHPAMTFVMPAPAKRSAEPASPASGLRLSVSAEALPAGAIMPRDAVLLSLAWQANARLTDDLLFQLMFMQPGCDAPLLTATRPLRSHPTSQWNTGDRWIARYRIRMPACARAGSAQLAMQLSDGSRQTLGALTIGQRNAITSEPAIGTRQAAVFGDAMALVGFDLTPPGAAPARLRLLWRARNETERDFKIALRVLDPNGNSVFGDDRITGNWQRPTSSWLPGEYIEDSFDLGPPAALTACPCVIQLVAYDQTTGERLPTTSGDAILLDTRLMPAR